MSFYFRGLTKPKPSTIHLNIKEKTIPNCNTCKYYNSNLNSCTLFIFNNNYLNYKLNEIDIKIARDDPLLCGPLGIYHKLK